MTPARVALACCSVAIIAAVVVVAAALGPDDSRPWLLFCGLLAVAAALQSVVSEPRDLAPALLFSLPPVVALLAEGSPTWLIGPLGVALLVAGELNALSWKSQAAGSSDAARPGRLLDVGQLAALGLGGSAAIAALGRISVLEGTAAVVAAAAAIATVGFIVFRRSTGAVRSR